MRYAASFVRSCLILLLLWSVASAMKPDEREEGQDGALPANESKADSRSGEAPARLTATRRQPQPLQTVTYVETADWVLNGRYLRTETGRKSDGAQTMSDVLVRRRHKSLSVCGVRLLGPRGRAAARRVECRHPDHGMEDRADVADVLCGARDLRRSRQDAMEGAVEGLEGHDHSESRRNQHTSQVRPTPCQSRPSIQYTGLGVAVMVFMLALAASVFTAIASAVLLWRYRSTGRKIDDGAGRSGPAHAVHLADSQRESPPAAQESTGRPRPLPREDESGDRLYQRTRSGPLRCASWHALGGSAAALFLAVTAFLAFSQLLPSSLLCRNPPASVPVPATNVRLADSADRQRRCGHESFEAAAERCCLFRPVDGGWRSARLDANGECADRQRRRARHMVRRDAPAPRWEVEACSISLPPS